jgi:hypothetical protein
MGYKICIGIFILFIMGSLSFAPFASAADNISITINIVGEEAQTRFDNPLMVAGIWHYVDVTVENQGFQELSIKFYNGSSMPILGERDETNYYEWKYNEASQEWIDLNEYGGYSFIDNSSCQKEGNTYSFCVGIHTDALTESHSNANWTLDVYTDDTKVEGFEITIEEPYTGYATSSFPGYINFYIDPFTVMDADGDDDFKITNKGNTPLYLDVDYSNYGDILEFDNFNRLISQGDEVTINADIHSKSWQPGIMYITGISVTASLNSSYIVRTGMISAATVWNIQIPNLVVNVGHSGFELFNEFDNGITFQYDKNINMYEGEIKDITVYISGNGEVTLDIWTTTPENISINKIWYENQAGTPISFTSTDQSEYVVTVKVEALRENHIGYLRYELTTGDETQTFTTTINISPPSEDGGETTSDSLPFMTIFVVLSVILVVLYMIFSHMRHRRR